MATVCVSEIFVSIQGESSHAGEPCFFVRLAGCNLRCGYCDTPAARGGGVETDVAEIAGQWSGSPALIAEITGGEPLLQAGFRDLALALRDRASGRVVLVETNGSLDLSAVPEGVVAVMDVKCPGSGEHERFDAGNLSRLRPYDEVKFVVGSRSDYVWARSFVVSHGLSRRCAHVLFGPVWGSVAPGDLARWILEDGLPVRLQVQLHRLAGVQ